MTAVVVSKLLGTSQSAVTRAAYRGEAIVGAVHLVIEPGRAAASTHHRGVRVVG